ncbi:MAG: MotA/TolQ/ExbB proton channel family protein [Candidatus Omnitrophota bacterium]|nr:MAG: MotA/TolQ/ExbB proton channel family protein [Candidatus Omnitrophota bacterium]
MEILSLLQKSGPIGWVIISLSILSLMIIIERLIYLYRIKIDSDEFLSRISSMVRRSQIEEAINTCEQTEKPLANILKAGILKIKEGKEEIKEAIKEAGREEILPLEKGLGALATIAHISPLLGLLGTVVGMINTFQVIQQGGYVVNPADLAQGIWAALLTTALGLSVAIPTYVAYNYLTMRVNNFLLQMEKAVNSFLNVLSEKELFS